MATHPDRGATRPGRGAGAAALRARIEAEGFAGYHGLDAYRAYMRYLRSRAPADLAAIGGRAVHRRLLAQLGEDGYRARQRAGFAAACRKHGAERIRSHIRRAHAERRMWRLTHPTPAEAVLRSTLQSLGYHIHPITYQTDDQTDHAPHGARDPGQAFGAFDLVLEAHVGAYYLDSFIPALGLAIEADGGVHQLRPQYDTHRRAWLQGMGITLWTFPNADVLAEPFRDTLAEQLAAHQEGMNKSCADS